jgi:hypothetical protein
MSPGLAARMMRMENSGFTAHITLTDQLPDVTKADRGRLNTSSPG